MFVAMDRKLSRRRLIGAGVVLGGAAVAAAVVRREFSGGTSEQGAPGGSPTPSQQPAVTPSPTPTGPLAFLQRSSGEFETRTFDTGDTIDWPSGAFAMDVRTGRITGYRRKSQFADAPSLQVAPIGPRFVVASWAPDEKGFLLDRTTRGEWSWDAQRWSVMTATDEFVVFGEQENHRETGRYVLARAGMKDAGVLETGISTWTQWRARGSVAVFTAQDRPDMTMVDLVNGTARTVFSAPEAVEGMTPAGASMVGASATSIAVRVPYYHGARAPEGAYGAGGYLNQAIGWDGRLLGSSFGAPWFESPSGDGSYRVRETYVSWRQAVSEGSGETWPAVVLEDSAGRELIRVRSAALSYGDALPRERWLADNSGFVAMVRDPAEAPPLPRLPFRYALIGLDGSMELLPVPPVEPTEWYTNPLRNGPVPSPDDPDLLSFGRFYLYNRRTATWFIPKLADRNGPAHWSFGSSPWDGAPGEMVFALGHGGHGGGGVPALIAPLIEKVPFPAEVRMRFRVKGTGSCLNLRERPDANGRVITCLADGAVVELDPKGQVLWEGTTQGYSFAWSDDGDWALVNAGGLKGWVSAGYLEWA